MKILKDTRKQNGYITAIINNRWVMAKVYDEPSDYGVNGCRVSKLWIGKRASRDKQANFLDQMVYSMIAASTSTTSPTRRSCRRSSPNSTTCRRRSHNGCRYP
jgi:hypothetical protein